MEPEELQAKLNELTEQVKAFEEQRRELEAKVEALEDENLQLSEKLENTDGLKKLLGITEEKPKGKGELNLDEVDWTDVNPSQFARHLMSSVGELMRANIEETLKPFLEMLEQYGKGISVAQDRLDLNSFFAKFPLAKEKLDELKEMAKKHPTVKDREALYQMVVGKERFELEEKGLVTPESKGVPGLQPGETSEVTFDASDDLRTIVEKSMDAVTQKYGSDIFVEGEEDPFRQKKKE